MYQARDEQAEAEFIAERVRELAAEQGHSLDEFAVFYRTNAQSRVLEDALRRGLTPYVIVGGLRFYERKEVKDLVAYLRLVANPDDAQSFKRIVNVPAPRGRGGHRRETGRARPGRARLDLGGLQADCGPQDPWPEGPQSARRAGEPHREDAGQGWTS